MGFSRAVATATGEVAAARRGSAIHERGTVYRATARFTGAGPGPFARPAVRSVLVRVSRGLGLPTRLPDVVGLGLRLDTPHGPQDLLLDSCGPGRVGRHLPALRSDVGGGPFGSLVALRAGDPDSRPFHLGAFPRRGSTAGRDPDDASGLALALAVAPPAGRWTAIGVVRLDDTTADQGLRLSPLNTALGVTLSPWWEQFRGRAYRSSRAGATR